MGMCAKSMASDRCYGGVETHCSPKKRGNWNALVRVAFKTGQALTGCAWFLEA